MLLYGKVVNDNKMVGVCGMVEDGGYLVLDGVWGFVIPTFKAIVMYGHFDEIGIVNMQAFLQNTRKMQFFVRFRFYGVYRLKTSA